MRRLLTLFLAVLLAAPFASAQERRGAVRAWEHESSDIPPDERIHFGHFSNGLRYAWVENAEPKDRCYVRMHVNAGSLAESDSELGMAHFLEHMAFNGSRNFEPGTLIEWFQNNGMSFGADTNAMTAFSETIYQLDLPQSDKKTLSDGLRVLRDFADGLDIAEEEVQAEKGVIDGEQRERDSAGFRMMIRTLDEMFEGTRFPDRLPIGEKPVRDEFSAESVRAFYNEWYRPENVTIVVVGDLQGLDPADLIQEYFADWEPPQSDPRPEPALGTPVIENKAFHIFEPELKQVSVTLSKLVSYEDEPVNSKTAVEDLPFSLANAMLNLRYSEMLKEESTPFLGAGVSSGGIGFKVFDGASLSVSCEPERWEEALAAAEYELRRALEFGFQEAELNEVRANRIRALEESVKREATRHSRGFINGILDAAENRAIPSSAETDKRLFEPALEAVTLEQCHDALVERWSEGVEVLNSAGNLDLGDNASEKLMAALAAARARKVEKGAEIESSAFAYASSADGAGTLVRKEHIEDIDAWLCEFENGVRLNLKATDFKEQQVLVSATIGEGSLSLDSAQFEVAFFVDQVFTAGGLAAHDQDAIRRLTAGRQVGVSFGSADESFGMSGSTTPEDLLLQLELMCAYLQSPGWREDGFVQMRMQLPLLFQQLKVLPQGPLLTNFLPELFQNQARFQPIPPFDKLKAVGMPEVRSWLEPALDRAPIELAVVGDIDIDAVIEQAARTFGKLPAVRERRPYDERLNVLPPKGGIDMVREIETAIPTSLVMVVFPTTDGIDLERRRHLQFLGTVVNDRLRVEVREKLGASYSPGAQSDTSRTFPGFGMVMMQANADPANVPVLKDALLKVAADLAEKGVTEEEVARLKEPLLKELRDQKRQNGFWVGLLGEVQQHPERLDSYRGVEAFYDAMGADPLSKLAALYLKPENASVLVAGPAADEAAESEAADASGANG